MRKYKEKFVFEKFNKIDKILAKLMEKKEIHNLAISGMKEMT